MPAGAFLWSSLGGALAGYAVGRLVILAARALDDTLLEITAIVLAGFVSYLGAELFQLSGVLAAVACGLVIGARPARGAVGPARGSESTAVWNFLEFMLTSLVFILIGLQLRDVLGRLGNHSVLDLLGLGLAVSATMIVSRFAWVFATSGVAALLPNRMRLGGAALPASHQIVVSWAGDARRGQPGGVACAAAGVP